MARRVGGSYPAGTVIAVAVGALCAAVAVVAVLSVLRVPLLAVLTELCHGRQRARFWWRVVTIQLCTGTALCTSLAMLAMSHTAPWRSVAVMVQGTVAGLLLSLGVVMAAVMAFERDRDRAPAD